MEFVGWWRENDKRHASKHSEQGQVRAGGDGVGGHGNVRRASQGGRSPLLRRGIKLPHEAAGRAELAAADGARSRTAPEMEGRSAGVKPAP